MHGKESFMTEDLQRASIWKRVSAYIFDMILLGILAVGLAAVLSFLLGYDSYYEDMNAVREKYETEYGVEIYITESEKLAMSEEDQRTWEEANRAFSYDKDAVYAYNMIINLTLIILTFSILAAYVIMEIIVPLIFRNGQTLGKKIFGIALMRTDGVKITNFALVVRTLLGKFTIETMVPVLILIMILLGSMGIMGVVVTGLLLLLQLIVIASTRTRSAIHDLLAATVVVDMASQRIFDSYEAMLEYKKRIHQEEVAKKEYR
ncbi:MAG: RDD family protein [Ruminococcaceae bacterium]|nr:RDD family protein [Oscillospiraceae bacterium]